MRADRLGRDELFYKIVDGYEEDVIKQLDEMEEVNFKDANGYSYLHIAVQSPPNNPPPYPTNTK